MNILLAPLRDPGFRYPTIAVGRQLQRCGHRVWLAGEAPAAASLPSIPMPSAAAQAFAVYRWFSSGSEQFTWVRAAARLVAADAIVTSVLCHGALLAGEALDVPVTVIGLAAHLWPYAGGAAGETVRPAQRAWRLAETLRVYQEARALAGLPARHDPVSQAPLIADGLLLRGHPLLEYPGAELPERVFHGGPCWWEPPADPAEVEAVAHHVHRVGKPVVYVHLGRTFGGSAMWPRLNALFTGGDFQAVVEPGRSGRAMPDPRADILVVRKPWMDPLLALARIVLTNATSAPVLGALRRGLPVVVAPIGSEQPLLAEACRRAGVALRLPDGGADEANAVLARADGDRALRARARYVADRLAALTPVESGVLPVAGRTPCAPRLNPAGRRPTGAAGGREAPSPPQPVR